MIKDAEQDILITATGENNNKIKLENHSKSLEIRSDNIYMNGTSFNPVDYMKKSETISVITTNNGVAVNSVAVVDYVDAKLPKTGYVSNVITFEPDWTGSSSAYVFGSVIVMEILINNTEDKPLTNTTLFGTLTDTIPYPVGFPVSVLVLSLSYADDTNIPIPIAINSDKQLYIYKRTGMSILSGKHYRASLTYYGTQN
jgi:hypothetical protein